MRVSTLSLAVAVMGVIAVVSTACAPGAPSAPSSPASGPVSVDMSSFKGKTLTYVYFTDGPDEQATRAAISKFEAATGATVNLQLLPFADVSTSLQARLAAGNAPEVARVADWHPYATDVVDFKSYFGADYPAQFSDGPAKSVLDASGAMLAVPSDVTINGPFVNVDAFKKAGVPVPTDKTKWTWDQMVADAQKVQQANGMESALAIDKSGNRVSTVLSQYGTMMIGENGKNALDTAKAEAAIGMLTKLISTGVVSKDFWLGAGSKYKGANDLFLAKQAAVYLSGPWQVGAFAKSASFNWAAVANPCAERCGGYPGGKFMVAFKSSKESTLGAAFVEWMNRTDNQSTVDKAAFWLPTRKDLVSAGVTYPDRAADMATFLSQVAATPADTFVGANSPAFATSATALVKEMDKVVAGQEDVATAVANTKVAIDGAIKAAAK